MALDGLGGRLSLRSCRALLELFHRGEIHPVVAERLPLSEVPSAHEMLESSAALGKIVPVP